MAAPRQGDVPAKMLALRFSEAAGVHMAEIPVPSPDPSEALLKINRAGVCGTDLQIVAGYVPGFDAVLGHEFVAEVLACPSDPSWVGNRVVGGINCNIANYRDPDPIYQRNHAPGRNVLGIIARDGVFSPYTTLPVENLVSVPDCVSDKQAAFAEPLAAAYRIFEQDAIREGCAVAVVGDGRLGLLVAAVLTEKCKVTLFGRHNPKMELLTAAGLPVKIVNMQERSGDVGDFAGTFEASVEVTGSDQGIKVASSLVRPMGTIVLKSTCSANPVPGGPKMTTWAELTSDIVVNEKYVVGSRCGPMDQAIRVLQHRPEIASLVESMLSKEIPLKDGVLGMQEAATKENVKVQIVCS